MPKPFYARLKDYYGQVGAVLRGEAAAASVFPNATDIGTSRERVYAEFLKTHLPSSCNVLFGGFVFNLAGDESKQIDLLVTSDICPQFNFTNPGGQGKTFACVEGLLAVASIKSTLTSPSLIDALDNVASLPSKTPLANRLMPLLTIPDYDDWPFKIIYASDGISLNALLQTLEQHFQANPQTPVTSRPHLIHVAGKYNIVRIGQNGGATRDGTLIPPNSFYPHVDQSDAFALAYAVQNIQSKALSARHVLFTYDAILDQIDF